MAYAAGYDYNRVLMSRYAWTRPFALITMALALQTASAGRACANLSYVRGQHRICELDDAVIEHVR